MVRRQVSRQVRAESKIRYPAGAAVSGTRESPYRIR
nr:MAG TPA: hypothetical protein [Caudoviricetes sp.]